ncbi:MAG: TlpA family protein disulfide reductase [Flavisolibacter sp.]
MKYTLLAFFCSFLFLVTSAQTDSSKIPPFKRYPTLPPIQILLSDSSTLYTKAQIPANKPVLFMIFSPDCSHCQHETEELIAHMDEMKDLQIVMITYHPLYMMKDFVANYGLAKYPNIVVGKDIYYITTGFFDIHNIPYLAMYDNKGKLIEGFEGSLPIPEVIKIIKNAK